MDDNSKHASSYQLDQEILDARGIEMTVEEVVELPTCKYADRVHSLKLSEDDLAFLKGLRRRIKNRLASQNSRRRSVENLRRLTRELRAVRACRRDALSERRSLVAQRDSIREQCVALRAYLVQALSERSDSSAIPSIQNPVQNPHESPAKSRSSSPRTEYSSDRSNLAKDDVFELRLDRLVDRSVDRLFRCDDVKKICAQTFYINESKYEGVLNLSVKDGRRGHGRKQTAPRRIVYCDSEDNVLDLKIKTEKP